MTPKTDEKICFVISPIGGDESPTRKWANQTIKHLIRPAVEPYGLRVLRADEEDRPGIITTHIIQRLASAELVIADLTGRNPNVFYELAVRHVARKPLVQIIRAEEEIPFDVQAMRTVKFELNDPDALEVACEALGRQVGAVLEEENLETPISQAVGQQLALESGDPDQVQIAELAKAMQALTAEVRASAPSAPARWVQDVDPGNLVWVSPSQHRWADVGEAEGFTTILSSRASGATEADPPPKQKKSDGPKRKKGS